MNTLTKAFESLLTAAAATFPQRRTFERAFYIAYGFVTAWGRHTISRALCTLHAQFDDWSAAYRLFSRVAVGATAFVPARAGTLRGHD